MQSANHLIPFSFLLIIMIIGFGFMGYALYGVKYPAHHCSPYRRRSERVPAAERRLLNDRAAVARLDSVRIPRRCVASDNSPGQRPASCSRVTLLQYFLLFAFFMIFIMLNMFIGILNDSWRHVSSTLEEEESPLVMKIQKVLGKRGRLSLKSCSGCSRSTRAR